jgi:hypothetical protein
MNTIEDAALTLDHVGAIAHDLDAAAARWQRLGFTLSPMSRQRGAVPGQTGMQPWASANRCAIFRKGYVEQIGIVDRNAFNPWQRFLDRFEGLHLLALRCANADRAYQRLVPVAPFLSAPIARERKLTYRGDERTMRFRNIFSRDDQCPEARYIVIEHQTPELLWQDEFMDHENGAYALEDVMIVADDPAVARRAAALDGVPQLESSSAFAQRYGWKPPLPAVAAITVSFDDCGRAIELMASRGIIAHRSGDDCWLTPDQTTGFVMRLAQRVV